jgi:hypothetical protein
MNERMKIKGVEDSSIEDLKGVKDATNLVIEAFKLNKVKVDDGITACMNIFLLEMGAHYTYAEFCERMEAITKTAIVLWEKDE